MRFFIINVNKIMIVDKANIPTSNNERYTSGIMSRDEKVLKSYEPEDNVLWGSSERNTRFNEFERDNYGLIGKGETLLSLNEDGTLSEYYSGVQVVPVKSQHVSTVGSSRGEARYYSIEETADNNKLYVPIDWLIEVDETKALSVLEELFKNKKRDVESEIIIPLKKRESLAKSHHFDSPFKDTYTTDFTNSHIHI